MANKTSAQGTTKTAAELRQWYNENAAAIENYTKAKAALKKLDDPNKTTNKPYSTFDKEKLRAYMKNPYRNYKQLIALSRYLYARSQPYKRMVIYNASMIDTTYRTIVPVMDMTKKQPDEAKILKDYWTVCNIMNRSNMQAEIRKMNIIAWREDIAFGVWYSDPSGIFILPMPYDYCKVNGTYYDGSLGFSVDMSYFDSQVELVDMYGEPFITMYNTYLEDKVKNKWQPVPDSRAYVVKVNLDDPVNPIPPYVGLFNSIIGLADDEDLQETKDAASVYKLLAFEMETKGDDPDDFKVDPDTAVDYVSKANNTLPPYVGSILSPLKITPISFEKDQAADVNIIENATKNLFNSSGGAQILNSLNISTTIGWTSVLISDEQFAAGLLRSQVENNLNRLVSAEKPNNCRIKLLPVSPYTKNMYKESLEKDNQYGEPLKLALNSLNGFSEVETVSMAKLEKMLDLYDLFQPPQSANTQSNKKQNKSPEDLSDEGDKSRDKG